MSVNSVQQFLNVRDSHLRVVSGNVHADQMVLGGITVDTSHGLQSVTNTSNVTTNTVEFSNTTTAFVTTANVEVGGELTVSGNVEVGGELTVTANAEIGGDLTVSGNTFYSNNTSIHIDSNVVAEFTGPHGRDGAAVLKKYPEIVFESGKLDSNGSTNTYVQAGYTVSASSQEPTTSLERYIPALAFSDYSSNINSVSNWHSESHFPSGTHDGINGLGSHTGEWIKLELPNKIKMKSVSILPRASSSGNWYETYSPNAFKVLGSHNDSDWVQLFEITDVETDTGAWTFAYKNFDINGTDYYKYYAIIVSELNGSSTHLSVSRIKYYGYEEDPPLGDTSVDTTFTSIMNTPQTTGANVYVDAKLSSDFTNQVTGPTPVGTAAVHDNTNKYWEMNGQLTSNVTLEANTFLEGDAPHSVSMWFNSSNLEANVSNTCVFSVSDQEKLDSINLDLQSNTWHNLTYAYQGEGGSRVTYLDGRKVAEDQAEDTFGDYPPFAMTGFSQGGYVVSASDFYSTNHYAWEAFNKVFYLAPANDGWVSPTVGLNYYSGGSGAYTSGRNLGTGAVDGEWIKLELPHKIFMTQLKLHGFGDQPNATPTDFKVYGSNNDSNWTEVLSETGVTVARDTTGSLYTADDTTTAYKYFGLVVTRTAANSQYVGIQEIEYLGHRENDLVRLPDPTNVLKYPRRAINTSHSAGDNRYINRFEEVSTTSEYSTLGGTYSLMKAFDNIDDSNTTYWSASRRNSPSGNLGRYASGAHGAYNGETPTGKSFIPSNATTAQKGEWIKMKSHHKLKLNKIELLAVGTTHKICPSGVLIWGSDDDSNWNLLKTHVPSGTGGAVTYSNRLGVITVNSTVAYKYHAMVMTHMNTSDSNYTLMALAQMKFFGTEEATSTPLQIGGGNIDKVANFRVYDKFVGEDQALEIWDAQKDEFGRAKSSMTLQKGRLGLGTTEPEGRLAVADEPDATTYGLQEFPPKPLVGYKTHIEGHGEYCASASNDHSTNLAWEAFDKSNDNGRHYQHATGSGGGYSTSDGSYGGSVRLSSSSGTPLGVYLTLKMPYKIHLKQFSIQPRNNAGYLSEQTPKYGQVWGSNDGDSWYHVHSYTGLTFTLGTDTVYFNVNHTNAYSRYALIVTKSGGGTNSFEGFSIGELRYFGYREQVTKQSVLHDGQLTLTKSLTVPRIGPALDADDTPRRDRLVVEYNTSTNPTFEGAVRDTSGRGNDITMYGATYDATDKSIDMDGNTPASASTEYLSVDLNTNESGDIPHSSSVWYKSASGANSTWRAIFELSENPRGGGHNMALYLKGSNENKLLYSTGNHDSYTSELSGLYNSWNHIVLTYDGANKRIYRNGELILTQANSTFEGLIKHPTLSFCKINHANNNEGFDGRVSNFKLYYNHTLTPEEVKTLYDMGRCDEGHHVVNFSKTRVGIGLGDGEAPRSALDVRDLIYAESSSVQTFTGQHICFPDESMETGLIVSAKKNKFVKLNGLATGKSAITIDESLPIVSLSNVAQDKACFGVVSAMEESNEAYRTEITGGLVSESVKIAGDNRAIVNSVGEGAIWVVDTGGALESGDYITTSNVAGYGQKQNDDVLHNYTVAKITMDCDFTGSNVTVQTIKREETGLRTIMEDNWNQLVDYDRSSNTETQYSNTLAPSAYSDQPGYVPREVTTIVDYTDGSNIVSIAEWSNLESNIQNTYQSNTFTEIVDYTKFVNLSEWSNLTTETQNTFSEAEITTYYQIQRGENVLDENGQLQFEDMTGATEAPYERRFLDVSGVETDSANAVHIAAFVGCTYHCG